MNSSTPLFGLNADELVIFDAGIDNLQQLIDGIKPSLDWAVLNANQDGIEQITRILANFSEIKTLHIVSHGAPGYLFLGNTQLSLDTLERYASQLQSWFAPLAPQTWGEKALENQHQSPPDLGDLGGKKPSLLLYGCNVAAGDAGEEFIEKLHQITQANIAASRTRTGNAAIGGNWNLEATFGTLTPELAFSAEAQATYTGVLADGKVSITGDVKEDSILSATVTDDDGISGAIAYQWQSSNDGTTWINIADATNNTFTPGDAEVGQYLKVTASYTDDSGNSESINAVVGELNPPTLIGSFDTPSYAYSVSVVGDYAYVADFYSGLQIIDISNPNNASIVNAVDTPSHALGVSVVGDYAYVADESSGLQIIDISNPNNASIVNAVDTSGYAYGVLVVGDYAYVADYDSGLQIIDISDPNNASIVNAVDTSGSAYGVSVVGDYAYVADTSSGLQIIDISDSNNASIVKAVATPSYAHDVLVVGDYAYVADYDSGLQIIDISDPNNASIINAVETPSEAYGVSVVGGYAYVADTSSGLQIIDISDPNNASIVNAVETPSEAYGVSVVGGYAYVADFYSGLQIIDLDNVQPLTIENINDEPTAITLDSTEVDEHEDPGTVVGSFSSTDADTADSHIYTLVAGEGDTDNNQFEIVGGQLKTKESFDYETKDSYSIRVQTNDNNGGTFEKQFTITVGDVNEKPSFNIPSYITEDSTQTPTVGGEDGISGAIDGDSLNGQASDGTLSFYIDEDAANNDSVGTVSATDPDGGTLTYSITGGNNQGIFAINSSTGEITIADNTNLDYETVTSHSLIVQASDGTFSDTATVTVNLGNVNDSIASISEISYIFDIDEDAANSDSVGTVDATDPDGDPLIYSITGGNDQGIFAINSSTGEITIADNTNLDYETTNSHSLTVQVSDGTLSDTATVTVYVGNVNDNTPTISDTSFSINEDAANNDSVGTVTGTDIDGDSLSYSITAGNDQGIFAINSSTGEIAIADNSNLDYETTNSHSLIVQVSDGTLSDTATVTVNVGNVNDTLSDNPPEYDPSDPALDPDYYDPSVDLGYDPALDPDYYGPSVDLGYDPSVEPEPNAFIEEAQAQDGPIAGATVYFDANLNGIQDSNEPTAITDAFGDFTLEIPAIFDTNNNSTLDTDEGELVVIGGTDTITGQAFTGQLKALPNSTVVTPLTTLVSNLVSSGSTPEVAQTQVKTALGLPSNIDLTTFDPIVAAQSGSSEGQAVLAAQVAVQTLSHVISESIQSAAPGIESSQLGNVITSSLSTVIQGGSFNLSNPNQIETLLSNTVNTLTEQNSTLNLQTVIDNAPQFSQVVAASNDQIFNAPNPDQLFKAQKVAQTSTTEDLVAAFNGTKSFAEVVSNNTGAALAEQIAAATIDTSAINPTESTSEAQPQPQPTSEAQPQSQPTSEAQPQSQPTSEAQPQSQPTSEAQPQSQPQLVSTPQSISIAGKTSTPPVTETNFYDIGSLIPAITKPVTPSNIAAMASSNTANKAEGTSAADVIVGDFSDNQITAFAGDDIINMGDGNDWISANQGNDTVDGANGNDTINAGKDNDIAFGSAGNDWMNGNKDADFLDGGEGDDTVQGGEGEDTVQGGEGDDWLSGNKGADFLDGGEGNDIAYGGQEDDILLGGTGNDTLSGNVGNDQIEGNDDNDLIYGGKGNDTGSGGLGDDTIYGDMGDDLIDGNAGNDLLNGGQGNDTLDGGDGDDELIGDVGDDLLFGAGGADTLTGGAGQDQFVLTPTSGSNLITDFTDGEDMIVLEDGLTFEELTIESSENATVVKLGDQVLVTLNEVEFSLITADDFTSLV